MKSLLYYANLASDILENNTQYCISKNFISENTFCSNNDINDEQDFKLRLSIIDSLYSTQMGKRIYGIETIVNSIRNISHSDSKLRYLFINYLDNEDCKDTIHKLLFVDIFGYNKKGAGYGVATSLISKYAYFLTNYKFPIFDSMVNKVYPIIAEKYKIKLPKKISKSKNNNFFQIMKILNKESRINDFDKLDKLLWLYGKIAFGSLSFLLTEQNYIDLVSDIEFLPNEDGNHKSNTIDDTIRSFIINNYSSSKFRDIIDRKKIIDFIGFALKIE